MVDTVALLGMAKKMQEAAGKIGQEFVHYEGGGDGYDEVAVREAASPSNARVAKKLNEAAKALEKAADGKILSKAEMTAIEEAEAIFKAPDLQGMKLQGSLGSPDDVYYTREVGTAAEADAAKVTQFNTGVTSDELRQMGGNLGDMSQSIELEQLELARAAEAASEVVRNASVKPADYYEPGNDAWGEIPDRQGLGVTVNNRDAADKLARDVNARMADQKLAGSASIDEVEPGQFRVTVEVEQDHFGRIRPTPQQAETIFNDATKSIVPNAEMPYAQAGTGPAVPGTARPGFRQDLVGPPSRPLREQVPVR